LKILVKDTGIGMGTQQQSQLFRPFQQGDGSITRRFGGTGLGLVITQRLVQLMGGEITVSSQLGEGSVFSVTIRLRLPEESGPSSDLIPGSTGSRRSARDPEFEEDLTPALANLAVLIVDDSPVNLKLASALLASRSVDVVAVESAVEALELISHRTFDLVLMDLEMPVLSGIAATRKIRALRGDAAAVPIVAVTAHAFPEKRREVIEAGMNDLLAKPYLPEQLYAMVAKWCSGATGSGRG
jgi:CheY-like chemotaxis protein